jgi:hypothetical protein
MQARQDGKISTEPPKWPKLEDSTTKIVGPPKRPRDPTEPGNFKVALTITNIAIFKETYSEDKLAEHDQDNILQEVGKAFRGNPI